MSLPPYLSKECATAQVIEKGSKGRDIREKRERENTRPPNINPAHKSAYSSKTHKIARY